MELFPLQKELQNSVQIVFWRENELSSRGEVFLLWLFIRCQIVIRAKDNDDEAAEII